MKVNFELYNKQKKGNNNISSRNISFNGYSLKKGNYGEKVFEFNYPYDSKKYDCYLEVCSVETDENGNYIIVEGLKNNYDPDGFLKLNPDCNKIDLAKTFCLRDDEPFAYHYALVPKGANRKDPNVFPIYKIDAGDNINATIERGDHEIYNIVTSEFPAGHSGGAMKLLMPDFYNPIWTYDDNGSIIKNPNFDNTKNAVKTFANKIGGNIAGIEKDVKDGKFDGFSKIISTPLFTDDSRSSHAYWNKNCMQLAQGLGNINNYASLQREMFKKGINFVSDGAYVNEGLEGVHFKHVLKWGENSPFFNWFQAQNLKNAPLELGVFSKNTGFIRHRIVNSPYLYKQDMKTGKIYHETNKNYDKKKPTYIQIYDNRLVSDALKNNPQKLIERYDIANTDNLLEINTHYDTIVPYAFEINPETYHKNIERLNEYNAKINKNLSMYEIMDFATNLLFPANSNNSKLQNTKEKLSKAISKIEDSNPEIGHNEEINLIIKTAKKDFDLKLTSDEENKLKNYLSSFQNKIPLDSYRGTRFVSKFEHFSLEEKIEGNFNTWDANTDIAKLNFLYSNADIENIKLSEIPKDQLKKAKALEKKAFEVQDYAISSATYWTAKTSDIINLYIAQQLKSKPENDNNPIHFFNKILKLIEDGDLPKKLKSEINLEIIKNVISNDYNLVGLTIKNEYSKYLLQNLMTLPLDSIEFGDNLTAVLSSPYIAKRATDEDSLGKSRYELFLEGNPHLQDEYKNTYNEMNKIYQKELYDLAHEILENLNMIMPPESKIYNGYNPTLYGIYVIPMLSDIIVKHILIKALAPDVKFKENKTNGEIIYDYDALKQTTLESLNIIASSPKDEARQVLNKITSGIKNFTPKDKKIITDILFDTLKGTNANSFKFAEMITDRLNAGLDWRIDATKDIADISAIKSSDEHIDPIWQGITDFWHAFTDNVYKYNRNSCVFAEITDEGILHKYGYGYDAEKYKSPQDLIKKLVKEANFTAPLNYSQFYSSILNLFGNHFDKNEKKGTDYNDPYVSQRFAMKCRELFDYMPYMGILNSYNFIGNHDKPRALHGLIVDTNWYDVNLLDINNTYYREKAFRILNDKYLDDIVNRNNYRSDDEYKKARANAIDSQILRQVSGKSLAMAEALQEAFNKSITQKYPHNTNKFVNENLFSKIFKSISDLAKGHYKDRTVSSESFGVKPIDAAIDIVIDQAKTKYGLSLTDKETQELKDATLKFALEPALKKLQGMLEVLSVMPGLPTLYAGDDLGASGYESESKNIYLQNRSPIHNEWLDKNKTNYKFIQDHYKKTNEIMKIRDRKELHALNDGAPYILNVQDGRLNNQHVDITAILRQGTDNSIVISLINPTGLNHQFNGDYNPQYVTLERIDIENSNNNRNPKGLTKGLTPDTTFYNAKDENDRYVVKEFDNAIFLKRLIREPDGSEHEGDIILDGTTLTLYSKPKPKIIYDTRYYFGPVNSAKNNLKKEEVGKKLSILSV